MKPPKLDPGWALIGGFVVAPAACALNSFALQLFFGGFHARLFLHALQVLISITFFTVPLGWMTTRLLQIWQKGRFEQARTLAFCCGLFAIAFWFWLWRDDSKHWRAPDFGALAIPFLWSISLPVFALFARRPKT